MDLHGHYQNDQPHDLFHEHNQDLFSRGAFLQGYQFILRLVSQALAISISKPISFQVKLLYMHLSILLLEFRNEKLLLHQWYHLNTDHQSLPNVSYLL